MSQIFPEIFLKINVLRSVVSDYENTQTVRTVGSLDDSSFNIDSMKVFTKIISTYYKVFFYRV